MRITAQQAASIRPANKVEGDDVRVWLDGAEQFFCLEADEEAGTVFRYVTADHGSIVIQGDEYATELVHGRVCIELPTWWRVEP